MEELAVLYFNFWNEIVSAYPQNNIPVNAPFPYLTYNVIIGEFSQMTSYSVSVYTQSTSFQTLWSICSKIKNKIPEEKGVTLFLPNNNGSIKIYRGNPFIQDQPLPEEELRQNIKAAYVNMSVLSHIL